MSEPGRQGARGEYVVNNLRTWGKPPFTVAVLHGGPGAAGAVAPLAEELSSVVGILEPFQTKDIIDGQVEELRGILEQHAGLPAVIVGHSWGAFLGFIFAARHTAMVRKLVLVACPSFDSKYTQGLDALRFERLNEQERIEAFAIIEKLADVSSAEQDELMLRLGKLYSRADDYEPLPHEDSIQKFDFHIHQHIWREADSLRRTGKLLSMAKEVTCPVVAIHGDYDPHLSEGVREPLSLILPDFRFHLLEKCGHEPWFERYARDEFYRIMKEEIQP